MNPCACPGCRARLQVPATAAGKKIRCPKCQATFVVPASDAPRAPEPAPIKAVAPAAAPAKAAPAKAPVQPVPAKTSAPAPLPPAFDPVTIPPVAFEPVTFEAIAAAPPPRTAFEPAKKPKTAARRSRPDQDDEPFVRANGKRPLAKKSTFPWLMVAGIGGAVSVFLAVAVGLVLFFASWSKDVHNAVAAHAGAGDKAVKADLGAQPKKPDFERPIETLPSAIAPEATQRVIRSTAHLKVKFANGNSGEGSGFFAIERGLVVSNAHVVGMLYLNDKPKSIDVVINSGEPNEVRRAATVLGVDQEDDLALLRLDGKADESLPAPLAVDHLSHLSETQKVYVVGFPFGAKLGKNITVAESSISSLRKNKDGSLHQIQVNGGMHPGNSGGPVVDSRGNVIGVSVAGIRGTMINFAVPSEKVHGLAQGRVLSHHVGERYRAPDGIHMPFRIKLIDPMSRVKGVKIDLWAGHFGNSRPGGSALPPSEPGDGVKKTVPLNFAADQGEADIVVPEIPVGQVLWVQPVFQSASGENTWCPAFTVSISAAPPLERVPANLTLNFTSDADRTLDVISKLSLQRQKAGSKVDIAQMLETEALESVQPLGADFRAKVSLGKVSVNYTVDGTPVTYDVRALDLIRKVAYGFNLSRQGKWLQIAAPNFNASPYADIPPNTRLIAEDLAGLLMNSYQVSAFDLPQREIKPMETWKTTGNMLVGSTRAKSPAELHLTCTFEGVRTTTAAKEAFIRIEGDVQPKFKQRDSVKGKIQGHALLDLKRGYLSSIHLTVRSDAETGEIYSVASFETTITRTPGNSRSITPPPTFAPSPPVNAKIILKKDGVLQASDPRYAVRADKPIQYHAVPVSFVAGKKYIIEHTQAPGDTFDPFLCLENPAGKVIANDDDGGGDLNSRIEHVATETGEYRIIVTALEPIVKTGPYTLRVSEVDVPPNAKPAAPKPVPKSPPKKVEKKLPEKTTLLVTPLRDRPHLDAPADAVANLRCRVQRRDLDGLVHVGRLDDHEAADDLLCFDKRAVRDDGLPVPRADRPGVPFEARPGHELAGRAELGVVDLALGRHGLELLPRQGLHLLTVAVGQTDELHGYSPLIAPHRLHFACSFCNFR
jgi:S1-C subfamily serine protease